MTTRGSSTALKVGLAIGAVALLVVVAAMGVGVFLLRRSVVANQGAGVEQADPTSPPSATASTAPRTIFVINESDVFLFDSKDANSEATKLAVKKDRQGFARLTLGHGLPIAKGQRVRILEGNTNVRVESVVDTSVTGWTDRDFLKAE